MRGKADYSPLYLVLIEVLSLLSLTVRPSRDRWLWFIPIALLSVYVVGFTASEDLVGDYSQGLWVVTNLWIVSDFVLLTDVQRVLGKGGRKGEEGRAGNGNDGRGKAISEAPFSQRLKWGFELLISPRGMGWTHASNPSHRSLPKTSKSRCIQQHLLYLVHCLIVYDLAQIVFTLNPAFDRKTGQRFWWQPWWVKPSVLAHTMASYGGMGGVYCVGTILVVAVGLVQPEEWPFMYGSVWEGYTVRRCWSKVWHQNMKRFMMAHTNYLADILHLPHSSPLRRSFKLYLSFAISALIHYCGDYMLIQSWHGATGALIFFFSQAVAITFESAVISAAKSLLGLRRATWWTRAVGYVWVIAWFSVMLPVWIEPHVRVGFMDGGRYESLIGRAVGYIVSRFK
ncbi:toxin biosynthesis protein [Coprinopsis cinerea AmutBmut pab1-1]|nr:toxin biosynthesis protein [Coprinopsis cinerea AmutBmut pab1-1]